MNGNKSTLSFIDTNIWLYRFIVHSRDPHALDKQKIATEVTTGEGILISTQVINEICSNLIRKARFDNSQLQTLIEEFAGGCEILAVSLETLRYSSQLRDRYSFSYWDSLIVASAVLGKATILLSEDMQDGLIVDSSLQIINPFKGLSIESD